MKCYVDSTKWRFKSSEIVLSIKLASLKNSERIILNYFYIAAWNTVTGSRIVIPEIFLTNFYTACSYLYAGKFILLLTRFLKVSSQIDLIKYLREITFSSVIAKIYQITAQRFIHSETKNTWSLVMYVRKYTQKDRIAAKSIFLSAFRMYIYCRMFTRI